MSVIRGERIFTIRQTWLQNSGSLVELKLYALTRENYVFTQVHGIIISCRGSEPNIFIITGHTRCGISPVGCKNNWFCPCLHKENRRDYYEKEREMLLLTHCFKYLLTTEFGYDAMSCSILDNENFDACSIKCSHGPQVPYPWFSESALSINMSFAIAVPHLFTADL